MLFCRCSLVVAQQDGSFGIGGEISLALKSVSGKRFNCLVISKVRKCFENLFHFPPNFRPKDIFLRWVSRAKLEMWTFLFCIDQEQEEKQNVIPSTLCISATVSYIFIWREPELILKYLAPAHKVIWNTEAGVAALVSLTHAPARRSTLRSQM